MSVAPAGFQGVGRRHSPIYAVLCKHGGMDFQKGANANMGRGHLYKFNIQMSIEAMSSLLFLVPMVRIEGKILFCEIAALCVV